MPSYVKDYFSKEVKEIVKPDVYNIRSRYDTKIRLRMVDDKLIVRNLKKEDLVAKPSSGDTIHTITPIEHLKPETTALNYYNDARLYWVILAANNMRDRNEFTDGKIIVIPAKSSLYGNNGLLVR